MKAATPTVLIQQQTQESSSQGKGVQPLQREPAPEPPMDHWFCPQCGNKSKGDYKFCMKCGYKRGK